MKSLVVVALGAGLLGLAAGPSSASTLTLRFDGVSAGAYVSPTINTVAVEDRGPFMAGGLNMQSLDAESNVIGNFVAWCMEVTTVLASQAQYVQSETFDAGGNVTRMSAERETLISRLFTGYIGQTTTAIGAAAFQLAIWEIIEEDLDFDLLAFDLRGGRFAASATDEVLTLSNDWLAGLSGFGANYRINYLLSGESQDLITVSPIPLPASFLFLGAGVGALAFVRRRRKVRDVES